MTNRDTDTISRQAVLDAINALQTYKLHEGAEEFLVDRADIQKALEKLPPSPSRPHDISKAKFSCPICGAEMEVTVDGGINTLWMPLPEPYHRP